jgi:hypothetical protein
MPGLCGNEFNTDWIFSFMTCPECPEDSCFGAFVAHSQYSTFWEIPKFFCILCENTIKFVMKYFSGRVKSHKTGFTESGGESSFRDGPLGGGVSQQGTLAGC